MSDLIYVCRNCKARITVKVDNPTTQACVQFLPIYMQSGGYAMHHCSTLFPNDKSKTPVRITGIADLVGGAE